MQKYLEYGPYNPCFCSRGTAECCQAVLDVCDGSVGVSGRWLCGFVLQVIGINSPHVEQ